VPVPVLICRNQGGGGARVAAEITLDSIERSVERKRSSSEKSAP